MSFHTQGTVHESFSLQLNGRVEQIRTWADEWQTELLKHAQKKINK